MPHVVFNDASDKDIKLLKRLDSNNIESFLSNPNNLRRLLRLIIQETDIVDKISAKKIRVIKDEIR